MFFVRQFAWDEDLHRQLKERTMGVRRKESKTKIPQFKRVLLTECFSRFTKASSEDTKGMSSRSDFEKSPAVTVCWDKWYETVNCEA